MINSNQPGAAPDDVSLADAIEYLRQAWDEGWDRGWRAGQQHRASKPTSRVVVAAIVTLAVIVSVVALAVFVTAASGYLEGMAAFRSLASMMP